MTERQRLTLVGKKMDGECRDCPRESGTYLRCEICRKRDAKAKARLRLKHGAAEVKRKRASRAARRADGKCVDCAAISSRFSRCFRCRTKRAEAKRRLRLETLEPKRAYREHSVCACSHAFRDHKQDGNPGAGKCLKGCRCEVFMRRAA